jgi:hypothetical protein
MSSRIRAHIRSNVVGYIALFLVLTGGTAQALNGSNTVFSDDIVNREVKTADLGPRAVTASRLAPNSVRTGRVADESLTGADIRSLTGADVADDSLTGGNVLESSLGQVPDAAHADRAANADNAAAIGDGSVTPFSFGAITRRSASIMIAGGTAENGAYNTATKSVDCQPGEMALNGEAFWAGSPNEELFISEFVYTHNQAGRPVSLNVTGGNDSGATRQLNIAVYCLAG